MRVYDENQLMKIGIVVSTLFLCVILCLFSDFSLSFGKWFSKGKKQEYKSNNKDIVQQTIVQGDLTADLTNKVIIPLPKGIGEESTEIRKDIFNKKVYISFPRMTSNFEVSDVINNSSDVSNIDYRSSNNIINVEITLNQFKDCELCFDNGKLYLNFFNPADKGLPVVVIDPGHGGDDVGAIQNGVYEKTIDLKICMDLMKLMQEEKILVYYTRTDDSYPSVERRVDFVNAIMPDLFISVHSNWYKNSDISGTSVLYNRKDTSKFNSQWLSQIINDEVVKSANTYNKGVIIGNDIHIVRNSKVP